MAQQGDIPVEEFERLEKLVEQLGFSFDGGFALMIHSECSDGQSSYTMMSNIPPNDLRAALKMQIARLEGQPLTVGHA